MYKFSLLTNTVVSFAFIGIVTYGLLQKATPDASTLFAIGYIIIVYASFLWFNYICFKNRQQNESLELLPVSKTGKVLSVVVIVLAIITILFSLLASLSLVADEPEMKKSTLIGFVVFIVLSITASVTAIINARFYRKTLKHNKLIVNSVINTIGDNTAP